MSNTHYKAALKHEDAMAELIQATLALAYEQQTANLIAAFGLLVDEDGDTFLGERIDGYELAKQIKGRLDLA